MQRHAGRRRHTRDARPTAAAHSLTFTSRAAVLGLTLCAVVLMLAYPTKEYLGQRSAISAAETQQRRLEAQIATLTQQHAADTSPAQIEAQARARLHFVSPGTRNYIQVSPPAAAPAPAAVRAGNATVPTNPSGTWYGTLWGTDSTAGS
jgi:cell division protein FtsB